MNLDRDPSITINIERVAGPKKKENNTNSCQPKCSGQLFKAIVPTRLSLVLRQSGACAHRITYDMDKAYFRNTADSQDLHISFRYQSQLYSVDRDFNFCRNINEKVCDALIRIRNNVEKQLNKKNKRRKTKVKNAAAAAAVEAPVEEVDVENLIIEIVRNGNVGNITNATFAEMLSDTQNLQLTVVDRKYEVVFNQPWVLNLVLPSTVLAGYKTYPSKLEMQFAERTFSIAKWYKSKMPSSGDLKNGAEWIFCADGFFYNTTNDDVGYVLKFMLTPGNGMGNLGPVVENITKQEVQAGPGVCPFETRHCFTTQRLCGDAFRIVSYNILADLYADSDYSRTQLFPYCPAYALKIDYRKQLFIKEIIGYNADIICLQEVDMKIFDLDLKIVLESPEFNYSSLIQQKGSSGEGVATFFRNDRFELVRTYGLNIGENIRTLPEFDELWQKICGNEKLVERICDRATTVQLSMLKFKDKDVYLLVANTHLYFHPDADHIRLLQIGFAMRYVEHVRKGLKLELKLKEENISLVFCGDFNSVPECGIYKLMTEKYVGSDNIDWTSNKEEAVKNVTLSQPFDMKSACGTPPYTNYTHLFADCLDYIFFESKYIEVEQVIPLPTEEELKAHTAIPSVVFPSDHLALVADLKFKSI